MNLSSFTSLFKKNKHKNLGLPESLLLKKLKLLARENNFVIFENITIYHHTKNFFIPLLILEKQRGIFLFEYKGWSYDDLKNAKAEKASNQESSNNTLAFEKSHEFIKRKFNELLHNDGVPISNYLLMENLNQDQYKHLDVSFHELLPENKIMFNDSSTASILEKMMQDHEEISNNYKTSDIMSTLLIQYAIIDKNKNIHLASNEQMKFINSQLVSFEVLRGPTGSGKTSSILLKAILEKLKNPKLKIAIIKPTNLACDILKKQLLDTIEHAIIEIDLTAIEIITPANYMNRSVRYDLTICDDSWACPDDFLTELNMVRNNNHVIMVENINTPSDTLHFSKNFKNEYKDIFFQEANPYAKSLQIISTLLLTSKPSDILVVGSNLDKVKLQDDLEFYIEGQATVLDAKRSLIDQSLDNLLLASYDDICSLDVNYVILMDICLADIKKVEYAFNLCRKSVYVLYDKESENLESIRKNFESKQN
ncbi:MAG: hypothetical protein H8E76_04140 [Helicobacteraceae bacterium]|nr:hypothetical protein [Candidatus Sulfurimonas ponti]